MAKHLVTIKGVKDGLIFILDDTCRFADLVEELRHKLSKTHQKILSGPLIHVKVRLGQRSLNEADKEHIRELIGQRGNLLITSMDTDLPPGEIKEEEGLSRIKIIRSMVRSGQTITHDGDLMLLGDVNPGGSILCTGNVYIMGSLRGMAHAGTGGNDKAVITASHLRPTQLRIANVISRSPDEWGIEEAFMEFAYIREGMMEIDKIHNLSRIRPQVD